MKRRAAISWVASTLNVKAGGGTWTFGDGWRESGPCWVRAVRAWAHSDIGVSIPDAYA